jgi:hypothetical protein
MGFVDALQPVDDLDDIRSAALSLLVSRRCQGQGQGQRHPSWVIGHGSERCDGRFFWLIPQCPYVDEICFQ